jgi:type II secretory pathway component GspD/PulD (secretin)
MDVYRMSQHDPDATCMSHNPLRSQLWLLSALLIVGLAGYHGTLWAEPPAEAAWTARPYAYLVIDQDVRGALEEMGSNLGFAVVIADGVKGKVRGKVRGDSAGQFLAALSAANGLSWYFDGSTLFIDSARNTLARTFDTHALPAVAVQRALTPLLTGGVRSRLAIDAPARKVLAAGPPGYLSLIENQLAALRPSPRPVTAAPTAHASVRIFRGGAETQVVSGLN